MTHCPEPKSITQGERAEWTRYFSDYSPTLWTAKWIFRGPSTGFTVNGTANGSNFDAEITVAQTAGMAVGKWRWWAYVTEIADALNVIEVGDGYTEVLQGAPTGTGVYETRTANEIALANIDLAISGSTSNTVLKYEIATPAGSRRIEKIPIADLMKLRDWYQTRVNNERRNAQCGGSFLRQIRASIDNEQ